ncbi:MAG: Manganese transport protein MntH, partial [uncultured Gemmatimonadaceae bacterium]
GFPRRPTRPAARRPAPARARVAAGPRSAEPRRGLPHDPRHRAHLVAEAAGLRRARLPRRGGVHGPRQLGHRPGGWLAVRLHAAHRDPDVEPHGRAPPGARLEARHRHRPRPGAGVPRPLLAAHGARALAAVRGRDRRLRPRRGDRLGDRAQPAVRDPAAVGGGDHRARRAARALAAEQGVPAHRGARDRPGGDDRRLLPVRDHPLAPRRGRGRARLHPHPRHPPEFRDALRRDGDPRRHGDAAQPLPALVHRADAQVRGERERQARGGALRLRRLDDRAHLRALHQLGDPHRRGRHLPHHRQHAGRRDPGRLPAPHPVARRGRERHVRPGAAGLGAELHAHRHPGRADRDGGVPQHPAPRVAPAPHHPRDRDRAGGDHGRGLRRERDGEAARVQPGGAQSAAVVRRLPARALHVGQGEDGRVREPGVAQGAGVHGRRRDRRAQRLAAGADRARGARL